MNKSTKIARVAIALTPFPVYCILVFVVVSQLKFQTGLYSIKHKMSTLTRAVFMFITWHVGKCQELATSSVSNVCEILFEELRIVTFKSFTIPINAALWTLFTFSQLSQEHCQYFILKYKRIL